MQTIDRAVMADGTKIQLEDWHSENSEEYPDLHGYTISAYPIAKNTSRFGWIRKGETFRLAIARNEYANYTDDMVLADYEALKNGTKSKGIAQDIFGTAENYVVPYQDIVTKDTILSHYKWIKKHSYEIREVLLNKTNEYQKIILETGKILKDRYYNS